MSISSVLAATPCPMKLNEIEFANKLDLFARAIGVNDLIDGNRIVIVNDGGFCHYWR